MSGRDPHKLLAKAAAKSKPYDALAASRSACANDYMRWSEQVALLLKEGKFINALVSSEGQHIYLKQLVRQCKREEKTAQKLETAASKKTSIRQLYESVFRPAKPQEAKALGLPSSYTFRHAVSGYDFADSLETAIKRRFPINRPADMRVYAVVQRYYGRPLDTSIELKVKPYVGNRRDCPYPLEYRLHSTTHEATADLLAKKRSAKSAATKTMWRK